jgi:16S rRNA A1518/A1519 N6-dimethyltransferase RsmA/KsgA/DIM1 with predicted DNA glycosylase/AP lyase activity
MDKTAVKELLEKAKLNPLARPQELSLEQWYALFKNLG